MNNHSSLRERFDALRVQLKEQASSTSKPVLPQGFERMSLQELLRFQHSTTGDESLK